MTKVTCWDDDGSFDGEEPILWMAPDGLLWDLEVDYRDADGILWHWAGGFVNEDERGYGFVPIMSRNDWLAVDVSLADCRHPMIRVDER